MSTPGGPSGGPAKSGTLLKASSLSEAKEKTRLLPDVIKSNWRRFTKIASSKFVDFEVARTADGGFVFKSVKSGNVSGSWTEYDKVMDAFGNTMIVYKLTYDSQGKLVHGKERNVMSRVDFLKVMLRSGAQGWASRVVPADGDITVTKADLAAMLRATIDGVLTLDELRDWANLVLFNDAFDFEGEDLRDALDCIEESESELGIPELQAMLATLEND